MTTDTALPELVGTLASLPEHTQATIRAYGAACARTALQSAQVQALRLDAERYRWLRSANVGPARLVSLHHTVNDDCNPPYWELKHGGELDSAIDAAMEKKP